jgi:hypothetical protein
MLDRDATAMQHLLLSDFVMTITICSFAFVSLKHKLHTDYWR